VLNRVFCLVQPDLNTALGFTVFTDSEIIGLTNGSEFPTMF